MSGDIEKVMSRVRKLLQLSRSTNEAEAALAAQRAAELMVEHNLSEASIRIQGGDVQPAEPIAERHVVNPEAYFRKRVAWKGSIASAVAHSFGCRMYWHGGMICYFGRQSAVQAATYTSQYLWNEVDRLADDAWEKVAHLAKKPNEPDEAGYIYEAPNPRTWRGSFRLGAASAISGRLHERRAEAREARRAETAEAVAEAPEPVNPQALALLRKDAEEVATEYEAYSKNFGKAAPIGRISSGGGYGAGREAGGRMHLGSGRAGLGAGMTRLKGE